MQPERMDTPAAAAESNTSHRSPRSLHARPAHTGHEAASFRNPAVDQRIAIDLKEPVQHPQPQRQARGERQRTRGYDLRCQGRPDTNVTPHRVRTPRVALTLFHA